MPPKKDAGGQKGSSSGGGGKSSSGDKGDKKSKSGDNEDVQRDQKLQAILLADSFTKTFRPVTWEKPKVLLPLVNIPMLDLTLEFLSLNGVQEVFVFCVWHGDAIEEYIHTSKWQSVMSVVCVQQSSCLSAGDALREIDSKGLITSDLFILISGDVISNMNLKKAIEFHKQRRNENPNCVMTVVMKPIQPTTRAQSVLDDLVVGMDKNTSQIVFFENDLKSKSATIPLEIMCEHPAITFRTDLLDCHVDICSRDFLVEFSDNFDYMDIRNDFIHHQAVNWEVGKHIYSYQIQNEYAARVLDPRTYHAICRDIVTRWVYPIVPDNANINQDNTSYSGGGYTHLRRYVYKEHGVKVNRSAVVGEGVVMGSGTNIEANAHIERTIIGRNVHIGTGAFVSESHLWSNARVEAGANVKNAIICDKAVVKKGAKVGRGCILSYGVVVGAGVLLPDFTRVSLTKKMGNIESPIAIDQGSEPYDTDILGPDGIGYVWSQSSEVETDYVTEEQGYRNFAPVDKLKAHSMGCSEELQWKRNLWKTMPIPDNEDDDEEEDDGDYQNDPEDEGIDGNDDDLVGQGLEGGDTEENVSSTVTKMMSACNVMYNLYEYLHADASTCGFSKNAMDMALGGWREGHTAENTLMEIKGLKFSQNKTFEDCLNGAIPAFLQAGANPKNGEGVPTQSQLGKHLKTLLCAGQWGYVLLKGLIPEKDFEAQIATLEGIQRELLKDEFANTLKPLFRLILQFLYDSELISEDAILEWIESQEELAAFVKSPQFEASDPLADYATGFVAMFEHEQMKAFVEWIRSEDEEDDDDEEEDDDEEDD